MVNNLRCETLACRRYRFVSSDRVGLHGLMGAFGPTGNNNFWGDDVWDSACAAAVRASDLNPSSESFIRISHFIGKISVMHDFRNAHVHHESKISLERGTVVREYQSA